MIVPEEFNLIPEENMRPKIVFVCVLILLIVSFTGCSSAGNFAAVNVTDVRLAEANYDIVATNMTGTSSAAYILGLSFSAPQVTTIALARVSGDAMLYQQALRNLWDNYEKDHGPREDKKVALVNVHYDSEILNLFFYLEVKLYIHADVVEFK